MLAPNEDDKHSCVDQHPKTHKMRSKSVEINREIEDELFRLLKSMNSETVYNNVYFIINTVSYKRAMANGELSKLCTTLLPLYSSNKHKYIKRESYTYANFMTVIRYVVGVLNLSYENVKTYSRGRTIPSYWIINPYNE